MVKAENDDLAEMCARQAGVVTIAAAVRGMGRPAVRWRLASGRWQRVYPGIAVTQSGPLTEEQRQWAALLAAGAGATLAGLTAAVLDGLAGFRDHRTHLLIPVSRRVRKDLGDVVVHRSARMSMTDVHPVRRPPRTRLARSLVDAAAWAASDRLARAILAAGVQQRLVRPADLALAVDRGLRGPRRELIRATLGDVAGGSQALSELDFTDLVRRYGLPEPDRQVRRRDGQGNRWLDAVWEWARLVAEIDGRWHMDAGPWWADMRHGNDLQIGGYRVLRFPAFAVRDDPGTVTRQIAEALRRAGWDGAAAAPGYAAKIPVKVAERGSGRG